ncbi:hypothetical protein ABH920_006050 [Catenulispora sp. EB89]
MASPRPASIVVAPKAILARMGDLGFSLWRVLHRYRDPVPGTLRLTARDWSGSSVTYVGVVSAPGLTPTPVTHKTSQPSSRWVLDGMDLPVVVDRARPAKLKILWKQVPTEKQYRANVQAQQMKQAAETAARMAAGDTTAGTATPGNLFGTIFSGNSSTFAGGGDFAGGDLAQAVTNAISEAFGGQSNTAWSESHVHVEINDGAPILDGIPATAIVTAVQDVNAPAFFGRIVPGGIVDLTLEVMPPTGEPYTTHTRLVFSTPERRARIATPGTQLPIRFDPTRPTRVEVDKTALDLD